MIGICDACAQGDHGYHSGSTLAFICIGCSCEWMPPETQEPEGRES